MEWLGHYTHVVCPFTCQWALGWFQFGAIIDKSAMNKFKSLYGHVYIFSLNLGEYLGAQWTGLFLEKVVCTAFWCEKTSNNFIHETNLMRWKSGQRRNLI